jgi:alpha-ribazole phosphatase
VFGAMLLREDAGGYVLDARDWPEQHILHLVETVQYTKENG